MLRVFICVIVLGFSSSIFAEGWTSQYLSIESVFTEGKSDLIVVYTSGGVVETEGCQANRWIIEADTEDRRNRIYSTLLAALASGQKIELWFEDVCGSWNYHKATVVKIHKPGVGEEN